jgi:hypothetical protein
MRDEPVRDGYLSPGVELLGFEATGRACAMCWSAVQESPYQT